MENRARICFFYIVSILLITAVLYTSYFSSTKKLQQLQYEVEEITKVILGRNPDDRLLPVIDGYVKKHIQGVWDELNHIKNQLEQIEGKAGGGSCGYGRKTTGDLQVVRQEEPNYALESVGASIAHVEDEPYHQTGFVARMLGIRHKSNFPGKVLDPSMLPGNCYAFKGNKSVFVIRLSHKIKIRAVTVEHISVDVSLTGDISNAPKDIFVYGVENPKSKNELLLGSFQYNNSNKQRAQTFYFVKENSSKYCKIKVASNYGNPDHTCIYRIAVHGKLD